MDIEKLIRRAADMQPFADRGDALSRMIGEHAMEDPDELDITELEFVSAAGTGMDYRRFMERMRYSGRGQNDKG